MDCKQAQPLLNALIDRELSPADRIVIEAHLSECEYCRGVRDRLAVLDSNLIRQFRDGRASAVAVADKALAAVNDMAEVPRPAATNESPRHFRWNPMLLAVAIGFLCAALVFQPWKQPTEESPGERQPGQDLITDRDSREPAARETADQPAEPEPGGEADNLIASIIHATGPVSFRQSGAGDWRSISLEQVNEFGCSSHGELKTAAGVLVEVQMPGGSRIRMNENTELMFVSQQNIAVRQGQIWCRAAPDQSIKMTGKSDSSASDVHSAQQWSAQCPSQAECLARVAESSPVELIASVGSLEFSQSDESHVLEEGTRLSLGADGSQISRSVDDTLNAERWMQPLMALSGHDAPDLNRRVRQLLARIGQAKVSHLYEQDIRTLGEFGALPLLRFLQSEESRNHPDQRRAASSILADTATVWMISELLQLAADSDPEVRYHTAMALGRLTGRKSPLTRADWARSSASWMPQVAAWRTWWEHNRFSCTPAPSNARRTGEIVPAVPASRDQPEPGILKTRN